MKAAAAVVVPGDRSPATPAWRVETISDFNSFLDAEAAWNDVVEAAGIDHPFLSHEWVRTWWESFGAGKELHILVVKAGGEPVAIAPLMRSVGWMYGVRVRRLQFISNDHTPRCDFIIARRAGDAYRAIWRALSREQGLWDVLELNQLQAGSRSLDELSRLAARDGFRIGLWRSAESPYVPLVGTWESYLKGLRSHHRANLRNRLKRLSRLGQVELEVVAPDERLGSALEAGLRLEAAAWKGEAGTAIRCHPAVHAFYTRLAERAARRGWLRLSFMAIGDRRIAFSYSLCYRNRLYLLKIGYDPEYAQYSPFNLLCDGVLRKAFAEGLAECDFMGTKDKWKLEWTRETRPHYWLFLFPNAMGPRLIHWAKFQLVPRLQRHRLYLSLRDTVLRARGRTNGLTPPDRRTSGDGAGSQVATARPLIGGGEAP
ncbi:MAG: GNAT family N-acetyltransferase [Candidatus Rokubacteria bacterium]|nr:GNAT family N-acetyltransferase [Candidatus Rokubacteria bacterium]